MADETFSIGELLEAWPLLSNEDRVQGFSLLNRVEAEEVFHSLESRDQAALLLALPVTEARLWLRLLAPDDAADVLQCADEEQREVLLSLLDEVTRREVTALLAYAEDDAGGLMNPRFARLRPDMSVDEAITYLRRQTRERVENIYYGYVLDSQQKLLGVVSLRELVTGAADRRIRDFMRTELVTVGEEMDQEAVSNVFAEHDLTMIPVVDAAGIMKGIVTVDDIVDVVREEATEDIQKIGGVAALDLPYAQVGLIELIRKRVGWLAILFIGESFTATAMAYFEKEISRAIVLALFVPLIVSSGGNAGSQACTLVIRALGLGELRLRDWWFVIRRELVTGAALGAALGLIGLARVCLWEWIWRAAKHESLYGEHFFVVGLTVSIAVVGVVLWGTLTGSMLPFLLRRVGIDPAVASAPFVATLVDVTGLVIYFSVATAILHDTLLAA